MLEGPEDQALKKDLSEADNQNDSPDKADSEDQNDLPEEKADFSSPIIISDSDFNWDGDADEDDFDWEAHITSVKHCPVMIV